MTTKKASIDSNIGFDPLAWMKGGTEDEDNKPDEKQSTGHKASERSASEDSSKHPSKKAKAKRSAKKPTKSLTIELGGKLEISQAQALKEELLNALSAGKDIRLNAAAVDKVDTSGLQVLVAFFNATQSSGTQATWKSNSDKIVVAAEYVGLRQYLQL